MGSDKARKKKDEPEEAEAVQSRDEPVRFKPVQRFEPGHYIHAEAKQARDITQNEMC
jgi:hypothetical protein